MAYTPYLLYPCGENSYVSWTSVIVKRFILITNAYGKPVSCLPGSNQSVALTLSRIMYKLEANTYKIIEKNVPMQIFVHTASAIMLNIQILGTSII